VEVRDAFFEWLTAIAIGVIPLLAHLLMHYAGPPSNGPEGAWTVDVLFVAITTSGTSAVSVFTRFAKGKMKDFRLGPTSIFLMTLTILFLVMSGMLYGTVARGQVSPYAPQFAWGLLVGAALASFAFEMGLATGAALAPTWGPAPPPPTGGGNA
jgi:hypothetical protein